MGILPFVTLSLLVSSGLSIAGDVLFRRQDATSTSTVDFRNRTGRPQQLASGFIYGIPLTPDQIPDHFYTEMGFNHGRGGGAQLPAPALGWTWGVTEYKNRLDGALSNYHTVRKYNGGYIFELSDLWGADGLQNSSMPYPGDDGDWTSYDEFLTHFITDMKAQHALEALSIDIWNEPDGSWFWPRSMDQFLEMFCRGYHRLRMELPGVLLLGPTYWEAPTTSSSWWAGFMETVAENHCVPDQWVWHMETGTGNMLQSNHELELLLEEYHLPRRPLNIDEYSVFDEQVPAGSAWWIAQLERVNAIGLRGNWLMHWQLWDFMSSLLWKSDSNDPTAAGYWPNGDWQLYKYYATHMGEGERVGSMPSGDEILDTFAVVGDDGMARVLCGVRIETGTWYIQLNDLSSLGLPNEGTLDIHTWGFPFTGGHDGQVEEINDLGWYGHQYSGGSVTFPVFQTDNVTAYAFEFAVGRGHPGAQW